MPDYPYIPEVDSVPNPTGYEDPTINGGKYFYGDNSSYDPNRPIPSLQNKYVSGETLGDPTTGMPYEKELPKDTGDRSPLRPVSQTLAERVQQRGAYEDAPTYMADARKHSYALAQAMGIDLQSKEGQQWMNDTLTAAKGAAQEFVRPPIDPKRYHEMSNGNMFDTYTQKEIPTHSGLQDLLHTDNQHNLDMAGQAKEAGIDQPPRAPSIPAQSMDDPILTKMKTDPRFKASVYAMAKNDPQAAAYEKLYTEQKKDELAANPKMTPGEKITSLNNIRAIYDNLPAKKDYLGKDTTRGSSQLKSDLDAVLKPVNGDFDKLSPQGLKAFVFRMNKLNDPTSATLLAEASQIADRTGIGDRFSTYLENLRSGNDVPKSVAKDIYTIISQVESVHREKLINSLIPLYEDAGDLNKKLTSIGVDKDIQDEVEKRINGTVAPGEYKSFAEAKADKSLKKGDLVIINGVKHTKD